MTAASEPAERGSGWRTAIYWLAVAVALAGLTHVGSILLLPYRSTQGAYDRLGALARGAALKTIGGTATTLPDQDPALANAFCLYDLRKGPIEVGLDVTGVDVAMLSVYGRHGQVLYGLTSRSASDNLLSLTIATATQTSDRARGEGSALARVRVETEEPEGIVVAQSLASAPSASRQAEAQAMRLHCAPERDQPLAAAGGGTPQAR